MNMAWKHKHFVLDDRQIQRARTILGTKTETETLERALEAVIVEQERTRKAWKAQERLLGRCLDVKDVYGLIE